MTEPVGRRRAGLLVPLFSCVSSTSWGIGDLGDLPLFSPWLAGAGVRAMQLLPLNEMAPDQQSPYSALSAMAIDPVYIRLPDVPDFAALGGESSLGPSDRQTLEAVRQAPAIRYADVRRLKQDALRAAFNRFVEAEWVRDTARARDLGAFLARQAWWIEDYALFRAIHAREGERPWFEWPETLRNREVAAIDRARRELTREVLFRQYVQWIASAQWQGARRQVGDLRLFGDLPFMVDGDSADVWVRQHQFRFDVSVGAPPDAFSETGQDWGMPMYRWDVIAREDFLWLRERARRCADLYDGYRVDHLVGFYRTCGRPRDGGKPFFVPADEPSQRALGERVLAVLQEAGAEIIAEDLGVVPSFVRASIARLGIPGFRVLRWERHWNVAPQPFIDPTEYPALSVATTGTHDTEPLAVWWEQAPEAERLQVAETPTIRRMARGAEVAGAAFDPSVRDALLEALYASGSDLVLMPVQDVFGWRVRINVPATVNDTNWTFRLPWPCDRWEDVAEARERQAALGRWALQHRRF